MPERTATEILLSIENRLEILEKRNQNTENLLKILLNNINSLTIALRGETSVKSTPKPSVQPVQPVQAINKDNFEDRPRTNKFAEAAAKYNIQVEDDSKEEVIVAKPSGSPMIAIQGETGNGDENELTEAGSRGNSRVQRGPKTKIKKISVSQDIVKDDKPVHVALVEVFDTSGKLVNNTRTGSKGRWRMVLEPGEYQVHVLKRYPPDSGKENISIDYQIKVPVSDKPMTLETININD